jgi:hypothetical protein
MSREHDVGRIEEERLLFAQAEALVKEQRKRLARLRQIGADTTEAERLLDNMEQWHRESERLYASRRSRQTAYR